MAIKFGKFIAHKQIDTVEQNKVQSINRHHPLISIILNNIISMLVPLHAKSVAMAYLELLAQIRPLVCINLITNSWFVDIIPNNAVCLSAICFCLPSESAVATLTSELAKQTIPAAAGCKFNISRDRNWSSVSTQLERSSSTKDLYESWLFVVYVSESHITNWRANITEQLVISGMRIM